MSPRFAHSFTAVAGLVSLAACAGGDGGGTATGDETGPAGGGGGAGAATADDTDEELVTADPEDAIVTPTASDTMASECARDTYEAERASVNVYLLLDISGSMQAVLSIDETTTQWEAVRAAVTGFIESDDSAGIELALNYFPVLTDRSDCDDLNRCPGSSQCLTRICDLRYLLWGEIATCSLDVQCDVEVVFEDATYIEACIQPGRCSNAPYTLCYIDEECPVGGLCEPADAGLCPGENSCDAASYEEPAVPLTTLPDASQSLVNSLLAHEPDAFGKTPTPVALQGAYTRVTEWIETDPETRSVLVLATDGAPFGCQGNIEPADDVALSEEQTLAAIANAQAAAIDTFVIGVLPDLSGVEPALQAELQPEIDALAQRLSDFAEAGGTQQSFNVTADNQTTQAFNDALAAIRGQVLPCDFEIPVPRSGAVSFTRLNLELTDQSGTQVIPKAESLDACVPGEDAWYYNVDAETETPTRVVLCPDTCERIELGEAQRVDIVLGCNTVEQAR